VIVDAYPLIFSAQASIPIFTVTLSSRDLALPPSLTSFTDDALIALDNLADRAAGLVNPTVRLGVTGLSRSGKTVFISSLVHNLLNGGRLPLFEPVQSGRVSAVRLEQQPDDAVPRFQYEDHIRALVKDRTWPDSTRAISELRITLDYQSASGWNRLFSPGRLSIDIVDYPGEWLLDLPLLAKDFRTFSDETLALAKTGIRAELFADYLKACKSDERSLSTLPPGRFLLPGDLDGSPALTFAPLKLPPEGSAPKGSLWAMMERRYEAYKAVVVNPFSREHFARLDRQIVLVDALQAINRGPEAVQDLERALTDVLACFRPGTNSRLSSLLGRRIDRVLVAATKADHLHHESHDRLEAPTRRLVDRAVERIGMAGAGPGAPGTAPRRAPRAATRAPRGPARPPTAGRATDNGPPGGGTFDGNRKTAIFPGDLPENPRWLFEALESTGAKVHLPEVNVVRFRPPELDETGEGIKLSVPHIRLDRAMQFLFGDRLA